MPSGPKNTKFTNRHADEAHARDEQRNAERSSAQRAAKEDAEWADDGDRKQQKKLEREREAAMKAHEQAQRRDENQKLLAEEERDLAKQQPGKVTKKQMQRDVAKLVANYDKEMAKMRPGSAADAKPQDAMPLQNPNHPASDKKQTVEHVSASGGVSAAVSALEGQRAPPDDRHIGKRARVQYRQFCAEHMERAKEQHPNLRRSQLNDVLWEMWQKSPQNPFVQRSEGRNAARLEEERKWMEGESGDDDDADGDGPASTAK